MPSWTSYLVKYAISNLKKIQPALIKNIVDNSYCILGRFHLVDIYKGWYRYYDLLSFELACNQVLGALFCLFLYFRSYPEKGIFQHFTRLYTF